MLTFKPKPKSRVEYMESNEMIQLNTRKGQWSCLKVSKSQKQNTTFYHHPKRTEQNVCLILPYSYKS